MAIFEQQERGETAERRLGRPEAAAARPGRFRACVLSQQGEQGLAE